MPLGSTHRAPARNEAGDQVFADQEISGAKYPGVLVCDASGNILGTTANPVQIHSPDAEYGPTNITAADAANGANPLTGALLTAAPTAGSSVAALAPGGDSAWIVQLTGTVSGTFWFEGSVDSTNGSDGSWFALVGRQTGTGANTVLTSGAAAAGVYRGNGGGIRYFRVRNSGGAAWPATVRIRFSSGPAAVFQNASTPAGQNFVGHTDPTATRLPWHLYVDGLVPVAGDALITTQRVENISGATAPTGAAAHVVPAGHRLRITGGAVMLSTTGTAAFFVTNRLRINPAGAAALTSPIYALNRVGFGPAAPVANATGNPVPFVFPNGGIEVPAGGGYAISQSSTGTLTGGLMTLSLTGYLYPA